MAKNGVSPLKTLLWGWRGCRWCMGLEKRRMRLKWQQCWAPVLSCTVHYTVLYLTCVVTELLKWIGPGWDRVSFLCENVRVVPFFGFVAEAVGNTLIFWLSPSSAYTASRLCPSAIAGEQLWGDTARTRGIPYPLIPRWAMKTEVHKEETGDFGDPGASLEKQRSAWGGYFTSIFPVLPFPYPPHPTPRLLP